jgi:hypothetical protein
MDLMEPVKLDLNRSPACSRCAFCAFLRLCLSSYLLPLRHQDAKEEAFVRLYGLVALLSSTQFTPVSNPVIIFDDNIQRGRLTGTLQVECSGWQQR